MSRFGTRVSVWKSKEVKFQKQSVSLSRNSKLKPEQKSAGIGSGEHQLVVEMESPVAPACIFSFL
jgi:hypothetical protein